MRPQEPPSLREHRMEKMRGTYGNSAGKSGGNMVFFDDFDVDIVENCNGNSNGKCILERTWELNHAKNCAVVTKKKSDLYPCPFLSRSLAIPPCAQSYCTLLFLLTKLVVVEFSHIKLAACCSSETTGNFLAMHLAWRIPCHRSRIEPAILELILTCCRFCCGFVREWGILKSTG